MPIEHWSPTSIYYEDCNLNDNKVLWELLNAETKAENLFIENSWNDNVSSTLNSCSNIIKEYKMFFTYKFLINHLFNYFNNLNFFPSRYFLKNSWFNKMWKNGFQNLHVHYPSCISGVLYYDQTFSDEKGIEFIFNHDTINGNNAVTYDYFPGRLILFPGLLYHTVHYKKTEGVRKSFSFNIIYEV